MEHATHDFVGILLSLVGLTLAKIRYPREFSFLETLKHLSHGDRRRFGPDQFAVAVLKQNKEVFERLADM